MKPLNPMRARACRPSDAHAPATDDLTQAAEPLVRRVRAALAAQPGPSAEVLHRIRDAARQQQSRSGLSRWLTSTRPFWPLSAAAAALVLAALWIGLPRSESPLSHAPESQFGKYRNIANILTLLANDDHDTGLFVDLASRTASEIVAKWLLDYQGFSPASDVTDPGTPAWEPLAIRFPGNNSPEWADRTHG